MNEHTFFPKIMNEHTFFPNQEFLDSMPVERRKAWHDALISGEYEQGKGSLYSGYHCCLGAYCHGVANIENPKLYGAQTPSQTIIRKDDPIFNTSKEYGDAIIGESVDSYGVYSTTHASVLNDEYKLKFSEIAQLIYPEGYDQVKITKTVDT